MSFLFPRVCWTHVCMCLFSLHNDSTSKATVSEETDSPLPIITAHRGWQDHKRKGEEQSKANEEGNTCDISYKSVIEILLAKRGVLEEPADKQKYSLSIFSPLFISGKWLCVTPFVSFDRFLVTVDDLWMALSRVWKLLCLFDQTTPLPFSSFLITSPLHLSFSLYASSSPFIILFLVFSLTLLQFIPISSFAASPLGNCLQFMSGSEEQSGRLDGVQRINLLESLNTPTHTYMHTP